MEYFNSKQIIDMSGLIKDIDKYYAHINESRNELLEEHIRLCNEYFLKINRTKEIYKVFEKLENMYLKDFSEKGKKIYRRLIINTINFHDFGKINPLFQENKMNNKICNTKSFNIIGSRHSIISSVLYVDYFYNEISDLEKEERKVLFKFLFLNAFIISRHHSNLDSFENFIDRFDIYKDGNAAKFIEVFNKEYFYYYRKDFSVDSKELYKKAKNVKIRLLKLNKKEGIGIYIYVKLLYSLLVASDFYSTTEFMKDIKLEEFGEISNIDEFYNIYKSTELYNDIRKYEKEGYKNKRDLSSEKNINILRTEMFLDAEKELINNLEDNIYFLEAPTGSGKSNVAFNLSFTLAKENKDIKKIYYVYPFNTLVEQNMKSLEKVFGKNSEVFSKISIINSITPIKTDESKNNNNNLDEDEDEGYDVYSKALLNRQFLNYPVILTTHVSIFNTMFNFTRESAFPFHQLVNSIIVLDEIQSYKNTIWTEIITFLKSFSEILNMKVIIMSATLPDLNYLISSNKNTINLITNREKYFSHSLFKNRVKVNYDLIDKDINELYDHLKGNSLKCKKILIEFIRKQSAYEFYRKLKDDEEITSRVELITGDDNAIERERIIDIVSRTDNVILVATQVIEAGVDIDMDIGYKDISKLDSDEQFMGRINRSCKKEGEVYFFNIDSTTSIYKNDYRTGTQFTLVNDLMREILINKDFYNYYFPILNEIKKKDKKFNDENIDIFFNEKVSLLNFPIVMNRMKLIEDDTLSNSVFLSRDIELNNGLKISGEDVWNDYKNLLNAREMDYSEREVKLSKARANLNYFIYQVKNFDVPYNERIGELYKIENGEDYFKDGKINKEKLTTGIGDFI